MVSRRVRKTKVSRESRNQSSGLFLRFCKNGSKFSSLGVNLAIHAKHFHCLDSALEQLFITVNCSDDQQKMTSHS